LWENELSINFERRYAGFTREQAQEQAMRLMQQSLKTGKWNDLPERLLALRRVMDYAPVPSLNAES
jgi:hypothetical protein